MSTDEQEITFNAWAEKPPTPPPRTSSVKTHLNPTPQADPSDPLYKDELVHQVLVLEHMLKEELVKVYHAQAAHRNQVKDNKMLKEYVANLLQTTKKLNSTGSFSALSGGR